MDTVTRRDHPFAARRVLKCNGGGLGCYFADLQVSSGTILGKIVQVQGNALNRVQLAPRWRPLADQMCRGVGGASIARSSFTKEEGKEKILH